MILTINEATNLEGLLLSRSVGLRPAALVQVQTAVNAWKQRHRACGPDCTVTGDECHDDKVTV